MKAAVAVLLFGRDHRLLDTRRWVLESAGYQVTSTTRLEDLESLLARQCFALLILCHSLSDAEAEAAATLAHTTAVPPRCLSLAKSETPRSFTRPVVHLDARDGPTRFVAAVQKLVEPVGP